jgi:hypothetical protein
MSRQIFQYHPTIGYTFIPNHKARILHENGGYLLKTNNVGFRSDFDFISEKIQKKRFVVVGDSYTAGDGVSNKQRYTDQLFTMLPQTEVYNFGLSGSGTDQQYLIYSEFVQNIEFDFLIIAILVENIRRVNSRFRYYRADDNKLVCYSKPYFELHNNQLVLKGTPVNPEQLDPSVMKQNEKKFIDKGGRLGFARKILKRFDLQNFAQKITRYQPLPEYNNRNSKQWILMKSILKEWISKAGANRVILMPLPLYHHVEETASSSAYQKRFSELAYETNVLLYDPLADLLTYSSVERRKFRFASDVHLTPLGHQSISKGLYHFIQKNINKPTLLS